MNFVKSDARWIEPAGVVRTGVRLFVAGVMLTCVVSCADKPVAGPKPLVAPTLASVNSRYILMPPIDDGGKSSGRHAVSICLPAGYDSTDRRYPVIYILDGEAAFLTREHGMRDAVGYELVHDQLVHDGLIDPAILVAVHNSVDAEGKRVPRNRYLDYCVTGQTGKDGVVATTKSEGYYQFLAGTIKPMIDKTYRTRPEPASTGVTGFSAGGAGAFWMTYLHPETFGMGICQSPPFWTPYAGKELQALIGDKNRPVPPVRLWIDAGSGEFDFIYKDAYATYRKLVAQGFRQNENIAFYTGHAHGHEKFDCNRRLRSGLYFMLRKQTPTLTGVEITEMASVGNGPISLTRPGHAILEMVYDNWFRLTDCTAEFAVAEANVVSLSEVTNELRPKAAGRTTLTSSFGGRTITQQVAVAAPKAQEPCNAAKTPITVDGNLADWASLPVVVDKPQDGGVSAWSGPADLSYRFGCTYDDQFFYVAIQTTDSLINSVEAKDPWLQDGIEVRMDARPEPDRLFGQGKEFTDFLLVAMSPARAGEARAAHNAAGLPEGSKAVCIATTTGHNTEIAIPLSYLNEKAGGPWSAVRVNVVVNDFDDDPKGFTGDKLWWQPDWRSPANTWGSGTLQRQPAAR